MENRENLGNEKNQNMNQSGRNVQQNQKNLQRNPSYQQPDEEASFNGESEDDTLSTENTSFDAEADAERTEVTPSRLANQNEIDLNRSGVKNYSGSKNVNAKENQSLSGTGNQNSRTDNANIAQKAKDASNKATKH